MSLFLLKELCCVNFPLLSSVEKTEQSTFISQGKVENIENYRRSQTMSYCFERDNDMFMTTCLRITRLILLNDYGSF